jgi:peptidoglycan glycosyltransferase
VNRAIARLFVVAAVLFVALIVNLTYWMVVRAEALQDAPENRRRIAQEMRIRRGDLLGYDGSVIAGAVRRSGYYRRTYPQGTLAPQLIGYDSVRFGRTGLESQLNDLLTGQSPLLGVRTWVDELLGRRPTGADVRLTLVPAVQRTAQEALAGRAGAVVALDPRTGAVIAAASAPLYDPRELEQSWERLVDDPGAPLLDRSTQGLFVPGSSFKVVTASAGLEDAAVTPETRFVDTGTYVVYGGKVTNYGGAVYGQHDFATALTQSINTTFGKLGNELGRRDLVGAAEQFGFWETPPLPLPDGAVAPSGRYRNGRLLPVDARIDPLAVAWLACGQEQLLATPLQMALTVSAVANGGEIMRPYLVQAVETAGGDSVLEAEPEAWRRAIQPRTAATMNELMQRVVSAGTGTGAALEGIPVAGKTGTGEKGNGTNVAWFVGFAPADDPEIAVAVCLDGVAATGGELAAPVAAKVLRAALAQPSLP